MALTAITFLLPPIIIGILYANSFYYNRRLTEYSSYALWTTVLHHLISKVDTWGVLAIAPQAEVYISPLDEDFVDDPDMSFKTRPDKEAKGVRIDLALLLHRPHTKSKSTVLRSIGLKSVADLFRYICGHVFHPPLYDALSIQSTFIALFVELKRPVSRHASIGIWLKRVRDTLTLARLQAEQQFDCAVSSKRYDAQKEAWLIAGTLDIFCVRLVHSDDELRHRYIPGRYVALQDRSDQMEDDWRQEDDRAIKDKRAALRAAAKDQSRPDAPSEEELRTFAPPFSDMDIQDYLNTRSAKERNDFGFQLSAPALAMRKTDLKSWSKPMRLGSPVANAYLACIREDLNAQVTGVTRNWGKAP
ncbi:hypothetical protein EV715DRAFT_290296 [Schizophyllum commune]